MKKMENSKNMTEYVKWWDRFDLNLFKRIKNLKRKKPSVWDFGE